MQMRPNEKVLLRDARSPPGPLVHRTAGQKSQGSRDLSVGASAASRTARVCFRLNSCYLTKAERSDYIRSDYVRLDQITFPFPVSRCALSTTSVCTDVTEVTHLPVHAGKRARDEMCGV